jgi:hypothetical protein
MAAFFSQQFTVQPGGTVYWEFGFVISVNRAGIEVFSENGAYWRYRGSLSTFVAVGGTGNQIFPEHFLGTCWYPKTALIPPRAILMASLVFRSTKQIPDDITFRFFGDDALN